MKKFPHFSEDFSTVYVTQVSNSLIERFLSYLYKVVNAESCNQWEGNF